MWEEDSWERMRLLSGISGQPPRGMDVNGDPLST